jgi:hypothetical protein
MLGRWHGSMLHFDPAGMIQSRSMIDVDARFVSGRWRQTNTITPEKEEARQSIVTGSFDEANVFRLDTDRIVGTGREVGDSVVVVWTLRADSSMTFEELISYRGDANRARTWHHFRDDGLIGVTLLQERRID